MMTRGKSWTSWILAGGVAVVAVAVVVQSQHYAPTVATRPVAQHPQRHRKTPASAKTPGTTKTPTPTSTSLSASFAAATGLPATTPLEVVTLPWDPTARWAVDPMVHDQNGFPRTLWVGVKTGQGHWHWYPSRLPGHEPYAMPLGPRTALEEAYDLHAGMAGPQLLGTISWSAVTGHVSRPRGITLAVLPANASPSGTPSVQLIVWMQSNTGRFTGVYGLQTVWDASNAATGKHDLVGFVAEPTLSAALAAPNP